MYFEKKDFQQNKNCNYFLLYCKLEVVNKGKRDEEGTGIFEWKCGEKHSSTL